MLSITTAKFTSQEIAQARKVIVEATDSLHEALRLGSEFLPAQGAKTKGLAYALQSITNSDKPV